MRYLDLLFVWSWIEVFFRKDLVFSKGRGRSLFRSKILKLRVYAIIRDLRLCTIYLIRVVGRRGIYYVRERVGRIWVGIIKFSCGGKKENRS